MNIMNVDYSTKIPNNVNLSEDRQVLKALEGWHPGYMNWWGDMGRKASSNRWCISHRLFGRSRGWAKFELRQDAGLSLGYPARPQEENRVIPFGEHYGERACRKCRANIAPCCAA